MKCVIERMLCTAFGLAIPVHVIRKEDLEAILTNAPEWWGTEDKAQYDNLIFILTSDTAKEICDMIGTCASATIVEAYPQYAIAILNEAKDNCDEQPL